MEVSLKLLNEYVDISDQDPVTLADLITRIGLEVEGLHELARGDKLVVGYVKECQPHPDSDHLNICQVEIQSGVITQIVCGAPNVSQGQKVIVALPGCNLGDGFKIKGGNIRGVESNGMICSIAELGLDSRLLKDEDKDGIHILDKDAPIGEEALSYIGLKDYILDIGLTPNRSDCMAMTSLAYEVAAILNRKVKLPIIKKHSELKSDIKVINETDLCTFFGAKLVKGVDTLESPSWLKNHLLASGIKPINNIVDISNYVMLETGQPIHMYDYDKLKEKSFVIKTGFNEKVILLDEKEYELLSEDIIVSTDGGVGCIAGVMGGHDTKIDDNTKNIVIEVATFNGATLRNTARRMNLLTDASQHYIKGALNTANSFHVIDRCADLLVDFANAKEVYETVSTDLKIEEKVVTVTKEMINGLLGTTIELDEIKDIFDRLSFIYVLKETTFEVVVPTYRNDISLGADLIEEVARMYGYDNIPSTLPVMEMTKGNLTLKQSHERFIRNVLVDLGLHETLTYTLTSPTTVNDFNLFHPLDEEVRLMSPLGEERSVTRKSVIPSLLQVINYNQARATKDVCVFEISNTYAKDEIKTLAIACHGMYHSVPWKGINHKVDFYVVKGFIETLFKKLCIEESRYSLVRVEETNKDFHPGRSGYIKMGKDIVGVIGQIHPLKAKKYEIKGETVVAELNLSALLNLKTKALKVAAIPQYPSVNRDIALVMNEDIATYDVVRSIQKAGKKLVSKADIFDVYIGEHVEIGKKSIAITLTFQDPAKTLDDITINEVMENILKTVEKEYDAHLRA